MANSLFSNRSSTNSLFSNPQPKQEQYNEKRPWKVLLVDDEQDVLTVSKMVLKGLTFEQANVELLTATSAAEAKQLFSKHDDIALAFVDVVMETDVSLREHSLRKHVEVALAEARP